MDTKKNSNSDFCVCCGEPVGEGSVVCCTCETGSNMIEHRKLVKHTKDVDREQIPVIKFHNFAHELFCINHKIKCTMGAEQQFWKREKRRLWMSLLPFRR